MTNEELDRLAAEKVMGVETFPLDREGYSAAPCPKAIQTIEKTWVLYDANWLWTKWNPSESWSCAGQILDRMRELGIFYVIEFCGGECRCCFYPRNDVPTTRDTSATRAITIAAIRSMGGEVPSE